MNTQQTLSLGEKRVRTTFNPSNDGLVDQIKQKTAELINLLQSIREEEIGRSKFLSDVDSELIRLVSLAQTEYESAAHWAVKAVTSKK